jgi:hypothetical protein
VIDYTNVLPWLYLAVNGVIGLIVIILGALANSKLALIHTTVNSNLAAQVQLNSEKETQNADLRVQLGHLQTTNAALVAALAPADKVVAIAAQPAGNSRTDAG